MALSGVWSGEELEALAVPVEARLAVPLGTGMAEADVEADTEAEREAVVPGKDEVVLVDEIPADAGRLVP